MSQRVKRSLPFICSALFLVITACGGEDAPQQVPIYVEGATAATVNGEKIYLSDVELEAVARGFIAAGEAFGPKHPQYRTALKELIEQKLMAQEAVRRGLHEDPAAARRLEFARERILGNLLVENVVASTVTEAKIDEVYAQQVEFQQTNDEVSIAHILLESEADALNVYESIQQGATFESMVASASKDTKTRMENGNLGYVSPNDQPEPFPLVIAETAVGDVSEPFQSAAGWHILKVKDRRTRPPKSREEARPQIVTFLTLSEVNKIVRELHTDAKIQQGMPGAEESMPAPESGSDEGGQPL